MTIEPMTIDQFFAALSDTARAYRWGTVNFAGRALIRGTLHKEFGRDLCACPCSAPKFIASYAVGSAIAAMGLPTEIGQEIVRAADQSPQGYDQALRDRLLVTTGLNAPEETP